MKQTADYLRKHYYLAYTIAFVLCTVIVYAFFAYTGASFIANADGYNQYYPAYVYIGKYIRQAASAILHGMSIPTFDLTIGFGGDILSTLNYYGLGDVFTLTAIAFPDRLSALGYTLTTLLRMYAAGITFSAYALKKGCRRAAVLAAALFYVYSGFTLTSGMLFPVFLTMIVYLPLLFDGIDAIMQERKFSAGLILAVALQAAAGFYFLYMDTIICGIYALLQFIERRAEKKSIRKLLLLIPHYLLGLMISAAILLPSVYGLISSPRVNEISILDYILAVYSRDDWLNKGTGMLRGPGYGEGLGLNAVVIAVILTLIFNRQLRSKISLSIRILTLILCLGYLVPFWGSMMNGFSYTTDRWTYQLYFMLAILLARVLPEFGKLDHKVIIDILLVGGVSAVCLLARDDVRVATILAVCLIFLPIILLIFLNRLFGSSKSFHSILALYSAGCVILMAFINNAPTAVGGNGYYRNFKDIHVYQEILSSGYGTYSNETDELLRTDVYDTSYGASLITGTAGTTSYYSIQNSNLQRFMNGYRISEGIQGSGDCVQGLGGRAQAEKLLSVDHYADTRDHSNILQVEEPQPVGMLFTNFISEEDAAAEDVTDLNGHMMDTLVIDESSQAVGYGLYQTSLHRVASLQNISDNVPFTEEYVNMAGNVSEVMEGSEIILHAEDVQRASDTEYYLQLHGLKCEGNETLLDLDVEGQKVRLRPEHSFSGQTDEFMVKIPTGSDFFTTGEIHIRFTGSGHISLKDVELKRSALSGEPDTSETVDDVAGDNQVLSRRLSANRLEYEISAQADRLLFVSIPYSDAWKCTMDGNPAEVLRADYGFMAVVVPKGEHHVVLEYHTPYLSLGVALSDVGLAIYFLTSVFTRKRRVHQGEIANQLA
jgi:uncharacterized membrane protein YfhO